ncbi:hypothetical protein BASA50_001067 [Batrachochytrium salamandrivorans]|uniref:Extracellular metalloproteinase n=1 Tax=Batrachochytrium salamandrivorans TaxID=1357716 RepID=A0ABQ8EV61_9FUNG|nr:hypothetical protein BASA50_001067 [Batrachochytrium salamandrivorans]
MLGPALTLVLALASSAVIAVPTFNNVYKRAVASLNPLSTELPFHFPESVYENIPYSDIISLSFSKEDDVKIATDYISNKLNLGENDFKVVDSYTDSAGVTHVYGAHMIDGVCISNHHVAAHVKNGQVTSFSSSFGTDQHFSKRDFIISAAEATVNFELASATASIQLGIPVDSEFEHALEYVEQPDGKIVYAYKLQLRNNPLTRWVQVWCDATTGRVIQTIDFAHKASYRVIQLPHRSPTEGFSMVVDPEFWDSSPSGWTDGKATDGNNAFTLTPSGKTTPSTRDGVFDTYFSGGGAPTSDVNLAAAAVNLFYITNVMHDISYQFGFTEIAGNFQNNNFGKGGEGGDAVTINVLNSSRTDDANFFTSVDGQPAVMTMYPYTRSTPDRNPGFDNGVVFHEYTHGISTRLTGGPTVSGCLNKADSAGMGEGWSDIASMIIMAKSSDTATTDVYIGAYATNYRTGLRSVPYTTDMKANPLTYGDLQTRFRLHDIGEVWASILWEVYWSLVTKHGFSTNLYDAKQSAGNVITMKIIIGGMMLQPCNPSFIEARNAILAADVDHYKGINKCDIYRGFAKRGLGFEATDIRTNDFSIPPECK